MEILKTIILVMNAIFVFFGVISVFFTKMDIAGRIATLVLVLVLACNIYFLYI